MMSGSRQIVVLLFLYACIQTLAVFLITWSQPAIHAAAGMMLALFVIWVVIIGGIMYALRDRVRATLSRFPNWQSWFLPFVLCLVLLEELIAVGITNAAPFFGVKIGEAYLTASTNYFDVVFNHSVIVFLPLLIAWAWSLKRYKFSPTTVFLYWGLTGVCAELLFAGGNLFALIAIGFWVFVYGLMLWLPTYCMPADRPAIEPRYYHYAFPILAYILFFTAFLFLVALIGTPLGFDLFSHPKLHFTAMG